MDYPLSFGIGQQGGLTGNSIPDTSSLSSTPALGLLSGASGGMDPQTMMMLAQALGKLGGGSGGAPVQMPQFQHAAPQALLSSGVGTPQMLAAGLNRFQGV